MMNWNKLESIDQLKRIDEESKSEKILLFKHSTRCSISSTALDRLERNWKDEDSLRIKPFYLDLLQHRDVSNEIASHYHITHQSPQILIISEGKCIYNASHLDITVKDIMQHI